MNSLTGRSASRSLPPSRRGFLQEVVTRSVGTGMLLNLSNSALIGAPLIPPDGLASPPPMKSIKIERVETFKVVVPLKPGSVLSEDATDLEPFWLDFQKGNPEAPKIIIKLYADNGLIGIGETFRGVPEASVSKNGQFLIGRNILDLDFFDPSLGLPDPTSSPGLEIAIYDLIGKTWGVPIHFLLGGRFQDKVAVTYWTAQRNEADLVAVAKQATELGFKHLKFKAHVATPVPQLVRAVVKAVPELQLGVDYNRTFSDPGSFLPVGKQLEGFPVSVEDPLPPRMEWWSELRQRLAINFALTPGWYIPRGQVEYADYSEHPIHVIHGDPDGDGIEMLEAIKAGACDSFNLSSPHFRSFVRHAYLAEVAGIPVWHGSGAELGIADTAFIHAAAATRSCTIPSDTICFLRESDLLVKPFMKTIVGGYAEVPRGPGLGVDLDEEALRRYQVK
jgi:L-alanine-DL-glutamate epimerase-like enolase superfamily enzyme